MDRGIGTPGGTRRENDLARLCPDQFRNPHPRRLDPGLEL
jgi:hypothetical protein